MILMLSWLVMQTGKPRKLFFSGWGLNALYQILRLLLRAN